VLQLTDAQLGMLAIAATACRRPSAGDGSSGIGAFGHHEDRTPTHGYAATREAAMAAFVKSWRYESRQRRVNREETRTMEPSGTSYGSTCGSSMGGA
jgi:hypothetical protein